MDPQGLNRAEDSKYLFCQGKCSSMFRISAQSLLVYLPGTRSSPYPIILLITLIQFCLKILVWWFWVWEGAPCHCYSGQFCASGESDVKVKVR